MTAPISQHMKYNTEGLLDVALHDDRLTRTVPHEHRLALVIMKKIELLIAYMWRDVRGLRSHSARYNEFEVNVATLAGKTLLTIVKKNEWMSFCGSATGFTAGAQAIAIDSDDSLIEFLRFAESFAPICTADCFVPDAGLQIG